MVQRSSSALRSPEESTVYCVPSVIVICAMSPRTVVLFLSFVLLVGYGSGNVVYVTAAEPITVETVDEVENNNLGTPSIVALQAAGAASPPRQCAGIGQSVSETCFPQLFRSSA